ncbi:hypothetical protein DIPPA_04417 [Diplonema papillatum]|nr:hypothetical protein DIPPA_04417 [Diplonema papillatum]
MRVATLAVALSAAVASAELSHADWRRAVQPRVHGASAVGGSSGKDIFRAINDFMDQSAAAHQMRDCESFAHDELDDVAARLRRHQSQPLADFYQKKSDKRTLVDGLAEAGGVYSPRYNTTRDAKCAQVLMAWAHHVSDAARGAVAAEGFSLPRMPRGGPLDTSDQQYLAAVPCTDCHYAGPSDRGDRAESATGSSTAGLGLPSWGGDSKTTAFSVTVNVTDKLDDPQDPNWTFKYYYDAGKRASRYEHGMYQVAEACVGYVTFPNACNATLAADGYMYIEAMGTCCRRNLAAGALSLDWMQSSQPIPGGFLNYSTVNGVATALWAKSGNTPNYYYATYNDSKYPDYVPVRVVTNIEPVVRWDFVLDTYKVGPQDVRILTPPAGCDVACPM